MIQLLRTVEQLRRQAAAQAEPWTAVGREVLNDRGDRIAHADTNARASYLAALHNNILQLCNFIFKSCAKADDRAKMKKEQESDA